MGAQCVYVQHDKPFRYSEGGSTVTRGSAWSAPGCHLGCGVIMRTDGEGNLVSVEGDPENRSTKDGSAPGVRPPSRQ